MAIRGEWWKKMRRLRNIVASGSGSGSGGGYFDGSGGVYFDGCGG